MVRSSAILAGASIVVWALAVATGMHWVWRYESTAGTSGAAPLTWPRDSAVAPAPGLATVVMLAHPYCPCTRASIKELEVLMSRLQDRASARVVFWMPGDDPDRWAGGDSWRSAAAIPGVTVVADTGGHEARLFRATTSGTVVAYDARGRLIFSGGITGGRGHQGDNFGRSRLTSALLGEPADDTTAPVFGCAIEDAPSTNDKGVEP